MCRNENLQNCSAPAVERSSSIKFFEEHAKLEGHHKLRVSFGVTV